MRLCLSSTSVRGRCFRAGSTTVRVRLITSNEFAKLPGLSTRRVIQRDGSAHFKGKLGSGLCLAEGGRRSEERVGSGFHLDYPKQKAQCQFLDEGRSELESFRREFFWWVDQLGLAHH